MIAIYEKKHLVCGNNHHRKQVMQLQLPALFVRAMPQAAGQQQPALLQTASGPCHVCCHLTGGF